MSLVKINANISTLMKKLLALLFSIFFLSSHSVIADDISDFQMEGISIGDSLLDYMTEEEILKKTEQSLDTHDFSYLKEPYKYVQIQIKKDFPVYSDGLSVMIKNNSINQYLTDKNEKYSILSIRGSINYIDDFDSCLQKRNEIVEIFSSMFPNAKKDGYFINYPPDPSGKSIVDGIEIIFATGGGIEAQCFKMDKNFRIKTGWKDSLDIGLDSKETAKWMADYK